MNGPAASFRDGPFARPEMAHFQRKGTRKHLTVLSAPDDRLWASKIPDNVLFYEKIQLRIVNIEAQTTTKYSSIIACGAGLIALCCYVSIN